MTGISFLQIVLPVAIGLWAITAGVGVVYRGRHLDRAESASLRIALEFSLFAVIFTLVPLWLASVLTFEPVVWRLSSLLIALFLLMQIGRITYQARRLQVRWPGILNSLLVLCGFLLTIEVLNFLLWQSPVWYTAAVLWLLMLAGIQLIVFVCYVPIKPQPQHPTIHSLDPQSVRRDLAGRRPYADVRTAVVELRSRDTADHPDRPPHAGPIRNTYRDGDRRPRQHAHRLAFTSAARPDGRPIADPVIRPDRDPRS